MPAMTKTYQFSPFQKEGLAAEANVNFDDFALYINTWDGWQADKTTWTRTGNHTFTVPTDLTARYSKGTKVRYKDGGNFEYGVVASVAYVAPTTTVTLITNTDYVMAAATITDNEYSYADNPQGFPHWFNYAASWTAASANPAIGDGTIAANYSVSGGKALVKIIITAGGTTTFGTGEYFVSIPIAASSNVQTNDVSILGTGVIRNAGVQTYAAWPQLHTSTTIRVRQTDTNAGWAPTTPFTFGNADQLQVLFTYEI